MGLGAFNPQQAAQDILQALQDIYQELQANTSAARGGGGGGGGGGGRKASSGKGFFDWDSNVGVLKGWAMSPVNSATSGAFGAVEYMAKAYASGSALYGGSAGENITQGLLGIGHNIPGVSDLLDRVEGPIDAAAARTAGITTRAARMGLSVDADIRKALFTTFKDQEQRASDEEYLVGGMKREAKNKVFDDAEKYVEKFGNTLEKWVGRLDRMLRGR